MNAKELKEFRTKIYTDTYSGVIPERFPVQDGLGLECLIQYSGKDLMTTQYSYNPEDLKEILEKGMELLRGDTFSAAFARNPIAMMFQQSKVNVMSKSGMIQHPETSGFEADEYDEFIKHPFEFMVEKILPRLNPGFDTDPITRSVTFAKYMLAVMNQQKVFAEVNDMLVEKYGFFTTPPGTVMTQPVPFDFLADFCRGFTKVPLDIKRYPEKVLEALEAMMPYLIWRAKNPATSILGSNLIMTHMATFLNKKDFEKFYWPTFLKICHICAERGQAMTIFAEHDWTRYIDYLEELPQGTRLQMEYGDPQKFKDRLGKKMVLSGFYPITLMKNGTKQQCIDKAKELIDILAPGGNFMWKFDKSTLTINDINPENYVATMEYILDNSEYGNAGELVTTAKKEDSIVKYSHLYPEFKTKYLGSFDEFKKSYPPVDPRVEPLMRDAYDKYTNIVTPFNSTY
ncbi:uroporphyrinogen decarboxylase (URO-D) [Oxobacter pfennigii]|uniref:Uroporphyrinogen decarboxylase (URO-D) n=1 Tax=Oxobacter pfennigii TaxID=36849 RepID=A0A0P8WC07_9CLOT|nr:uroporphyrinogen decarboxylase family protein [Oxobacter pfennigii]KPU45443.1 uroporphyrinogen decarboxylase (URO-D) [Oxobacter pfennigii]